MCTPKGPYQCPALNDRQFRTTSEAALVTNDYIALPFGPMQYFKPLHPQLFCGDLVDHFVYNVKQYSCMEVKDFPHYIFHNNNILRILFSSACHMTFRNPMKSNNRSEINAKGSCRENHDLCNIFVRTQSSCFINAYIFLLRILPLYLMPQGQIKCWYITLNNRSVSLCYVACDEIQPVILPTFGSRSLRSPHRV